MSELKQGQEVYVSDELALLNKPIKHLVGKKRNGLFVCEDENGAISVWSYVVPVPEQIIVKWTFETCPLPPFTVKDKEVGTYHIVTALCSTSVSVDWHGSKSFQEFLEEFDYIPDPMNRSHEIPCGSKE